uniref:Uncharacterized protein n=1 Tax=Galaxaura rugosa TaxID=268570 RepID=A0A1G4NSZ3_9FLOR|nr:Hypothetical protein ORF_8 [Galaxaura rugosa]SCW21734.1 Hypothetical protein ORF_8 [Galaxaura rugosa]
MESINLSYKIEEMDNGFDLNNEALIGWSSTCLDQTISYYMEFNNEEENLTSDDPRKDDYKM